MTARPILSRLVVGVVTAGLVVGGVSVAAVAPWPVVARGPVGVETTPEAARSVAACDGPLLALGRDDTAAGEITEAASARVVSGTDAPRDAPPEQIELLVPDRTDGGTPPLAFIADPEAAAETTDVAAASASVLDDVDLRGLAVSACTRAEMESWLVGGSGATGASDVVLLTNPGDVPAQVDLRVFGATGAQDPIAGQDIVVGARSQRAVPLAALARGEQLPVIRVSSEGAPVRASLQTALTRTLVAGGVDQVAAAAVPALSQVVPAVAVTVAPGGASAGGMSVRVLAPDTAATARVDVRAVAGGGVVATEEAVPLTVGSPLELELTGMPVGDYTVAVTADAPVVAAAWASTDLSAPADFAWTVAAPLVDAPTLVAIADAPAPLLTVVADADTTVSLDVVGGSDPQTADLVAGEAWSVPVVAGRVYRFDPGAGGVRASVGFSAAGQLGGYPVTGSAAAAAQLTVYP